jgi:hypothetical protein
VRPSTWPNSPCAVRSTKPVSHGSTSTHRPSAPRRHLGRPNRVSSIPNQWGGWRLAQHGCAQAAKRPLHRRPRHPMGAGHLGHRTVGRAGPVALGDAAGPGEPSLGLSAHRRRVPQAWRAAPAYQRWARLLALWRLVDRCLSLGAQGRNARWCSIRADRAVLFGPVRRCWVGVMRSRDGCTKFP